MYVAWRLELQLCASRSPLQWRDTDPPKLGVFAPKFHDNYNMKKGIHEVRHQLNTVFKAVIVPVYFGVDFPTKPRFRAKPA